MYHLPSDGRKRFPRSTIRRVKSSPNLAAILVLLFLFACADHEPGAIDGGGAASESKRLRVGLLTPGSVADGGWNQIAYEGLQRIEKELGAEISHQETKTPAEFEEGFRYFGANGYDLAFGHGFEFQDAALAAGKRHPKTIFITTSGSSVGSNVSPMVFELEQMTYLLGVIAAKESKTGKAGLVGGIRLPSIDSTFHAFKEGAKSVDPSFEVKEVYLGTFDDLGAAKVATSSLIDSGADFIFHQANEAGRGVFQACSERKIRCFGSNRNQNDLAADVIVASAVLDVPAAFVHMAKLVRDGTFEPKVYFLGSREGIVSLAWNERLKSSLDPETISAVEQLHDRIRTGAFKVPRREF